MRGIAGIHPGWGVTTVRVAMAIILIVSGWKKVTGGMAAVTVLFDKVGMPLPGVTGPFIAGFELIGGLLLLLGLAGRWLGLLIAIEFVVATFYVKLPGAGWDPSRIDVMLLAGGILLFLAGSGRAAIDEMWLERGQTT
jgi:putative oxidoreductase